MKEILPETNLHVVSERQQTAPEADARFAELVGGRLGIAAVDTGSARRVGYRPGERFPMCSTFKLPLVAAVLKRVDAGEESLGRRIAYDAAALLEYAPVTTKTGLKRLRAGLPAEYRAGDKTGTGNNGATNDLAIARPPSKPPILIAAYSWGSTASTERLSDVLAQAARLVLHD
jgi:beta-lactamase class A